MLENLKNLFERQARQVRLLVRERVGLKYLIIILNEKF